MGARHRMIESSEQRGKPGVTMACDIVAAALLCALTMTALLVSAEPEKRTVTGTLEPSPTSRPVRQEGTIVAVSADSVTARSANGYTQTYLITPNTAVLTNGGNRHVAASSRFAINDRVDIVGTIRNGAVLATVVADRDMTNGAGPPMDYLAAQEISAKN